MTVTTCADSLAHRPDLFCFLSGGVTNVCCYFWRGSNFCCTPCLWIVQTSETTQIDKTSNCELKPGNYFRVTYRAAVLCKIRNNHRFCLKQTFQAFMFFASISGSFPLSTTKSRKSLSFRFKQTTRKIARTRTPNITRRHGDLERAQRTLQTDANESLQRETPLPKH